MVKEALCGSVVQSADDCYRHAWLGYMIDKPPSEDPIIQTGVRPWELREHRPTMTATRGAYKPYSTWAASFPLLKILRLTGWTVLDENTVRGNQLPHLEDNGDVVLADSDMVKRIWLLGCTSSSSTILDHHNEMWLFSNSLFLTAWVSQSSQEGLGPCDSCYRTCLFVGAANLWAWPSIIFSMD